MSDEAKSGCCQNPDGGPSATRSTMPIWMVMATFVLLFFGAVYFDRHSGWFSRQVYSPYVSTEQLAAAQPRSGAAATAAHGKQVYETVCGVCHGADGLGKPAQAPPLAGSEWVVARGFDRLTHIPLAGLNGPMQVEGKDWNLTMAPMGAALSDSDLAAVLTYIRGAWGNQAGAVTADNVKAIRTSLGTHSQPLNGQQMKTMPE